VGGEAQALRAALAQLPDTADPTALSRLRAAHPGAGPALVGALATQVRLQRLARDRLGSWADDMILEEEALQQATRRAVARYRAARLAEQLGTDLTVTDIGCGLGVDARALAETGFTVLAIEQDPWRAEAAEVNLGGFAGRQAGGLGLADGDPPRVRVLCADATALGSTVLESCGAAYVDPARRAHAGPRDVGGGRSQPLGDPAQWSPPWPWVVALAERMPVVAKVAPGISARQVPPGADIEWLDHGGATVEASVWLGELGQGDVRATALTDTGAETLRAPRDAPMVIGPVTSTALTYLLEPAECVVHADLVGALATRCDAPRLDAGTWLTTDDPPESRLVKPWLITTEVPHRAGDLRAWLRGHGSVTWKTRDAQVSAAVWDRRVGHRPSRDGRAVTIVVTAAGRAFAVERAID
jgi:hypothetical protein